MDSYDLPDIDLNEPLDESFVRWLLNEESGANRQGAVVVEPPPISPETLWIQQCMEEDSFPIPPEDEAEEPMVEVAETEEQGAIIAGSSTSNATENEAKDWMDRCLLPWSDDENSTGK